MPTCTCGLDFVQARLEGRELESYAVIHDDDYLEVVEEEAATRAESDEAKRLKMIAQTSTRVGTLLVCPDCGNLLFSKPSRGGEDDEVMILRKTRST